MGNGFSFFTGNSAATVDDTPDKAAVPSPTIESKQEQDTNPAAAKSPKQASHGAREKRVVSAAKAVAKHKQTTAAKRGKKTDLDIKWDNQFKELQKFQKKTGHCLVPFHYDANPSLGLWVSNQRCRKDKLSEDRLDRLDAIGFEWSVRQTSSSPSPPRSKQTTPKAKMTIPKAKATATSKKEEKKVSSATKKSVKPKLSPPRKKTLEANWNSSFEDLQKFKKKMNHCRVPRRYEQNFQLGEWVHTQRQSFRKGILPQKRIDRLNEVGFEWALSR